MTHSWSQMCHICSHDGDSVCLCVCRSGGLPVVEGDGVTQGGKGFESNLHFQINCREEGAAQASAGEMIGISLEESDA